MRIIEETIITPITVVIMIIIVTMFMQFTIDLTTNAKAHIAETKELYSEKESTIIRSLISANYDIK